MKKIIIIITSICVLTSCKTSKASCDAYGKIDKNVLYKNYDTLFLKLKNEKI